VVSQHEGVIGLRTGISAFASLAMLVSPLPVSLFAATPLAAQPASPDPARLKADVETLVSFGTRHTLSSATDPKRGIGAARKWAANMLTEIGKSCGGCLTIETIGDRFTGPRAPDGVQVEDVLAIQPGSDGVANVIIIAAHIDSRVTDVMNITADAPGANDNASGSALVIETTRLLSREKHRATIVYALLSGEEQGLWGGQLLARTAKARGWHVSAMLNNDIVGNVIGTDGRKVADRVRVFSEGIRASEDDAATKARRMAGGEDDGPGRALARYVTQISRNDTRAGSLKVFAVRRPDRFSRGGDQMPSLELGFPAVRFTVGIENYTQQHQDLRRENGIDYGDTADRMDFAYLAKVTALNVATMRALGAAPPAPDQASLGGALSSDTTVRWTPVKDAAGYHLYTRPADSFAWQSGPFVGADASEATLKDIIVDDNFVGVAALGGDGKRGAAESTITFAGLPPRK
jgi:hypothetical protein